MIRFDCENSTQLIFRVSCTDAIEVLQYVYVAALVFERE